MIGGANPTMKHAIHDFSAKLRQPSVAPTLDAYVGWRRAVEAARARATRGGARAYRQS